MAIKNWWLSRSYALRGLLVGVLAWLILDLSTSELFGYSSNNIVVVAMQAIESFVHLPYALVTRGSWFGWHLTNLGSVIFLGAALLIFSAIGLVVDIIQAKNRIFPKSDKAFLILIALVFFVWAFVLLRQTCIQHLCQYYLPE